jgi:hypothetical protein
MATRPGKETVASDRCDEPTYGSANGRMHMALMHGPAWRNYDVTSRGDGSTTVRIQTGDGFAASAAILREEVSLEFETLEEALDCAGSSRISAAGVIVTVMVDGEERIGRELLERVPIAATLTQRQRDPRLYPP